MSSASVESMETTVENGQAALSFEYSIGDYGTALFEGPDDRVIAETRIEPDHTTSSLSVGTLEAGEYELLIRQDGDTVTSETLTVEGPDPLLSNIDSSWTYNELEQVTVEIENVGDVPVYVEEALFEISDLDPSEWVNTYLDAGESRAIGIDGGIEIDTSGTTGGSVSVTTAAGPVTGEFSHELAPASLKFTSIEPNWDGNTLVDVVVTVRNAGDVPTESQATATADGDELDTTPTEQFDPGQSEELTLRSFGTLYEATSGGEAEIDIVVDSPSGSVSETISRDIDGAEISLDTISTGWESGRLVRVSARVSNSGDLEATPSATVLFEDSEIVDETLTIPADETITFPLIDASSTYDDAYGVWSGGQKEVTVELDQGDGTVSETDTKEFDGLETDFSNIGTTFFSAGYDTDDVELSRVNFNVRNSGDVLLTYDSVEIEFGGASRAEDLYSPKTLLPGSSETEYWSPVDNIVVSPGEEDLAILLLRDGDEVARTTTTVTAE